MTVSSDDELAALKRIGRIVADTLEAMGRAIEPGMTTRELDADRARVPGGGRARGRRPRWPTTFPGATCISVNEEIAHGIPGDRRIAAGRPRQHRRLGREGRLLRRYRRLLRRAARDARGRAAVPGRAPRHVDGAARRSAPASRSPASAGRSGAFARKNGYTLVRNLASHGVGLSLHEEPTEIATWPDASERRIMRGGAGLHGRAVPVARRRLGRGRRRPVDALQPAAGAHGPVRAHGRRHPERPARPHHGELRAAPAAHSAGSRAG